MAGSLDLYAEEKLAALEAQALRRRLRDTAREGVWIVRGGRRLLSFSCNDYLGLSVHPQLKAAAKAAIDRYGVGAGASRLVTGNHPLYGELEQRLAELKKTDDACVFGSGYLANTGIVPSLVGTGDVIFADALCHSCLWAGAQLSQARLHVFRHNDVNHLEELLARNRPAHDHALILTDGVFSMDGDLAPLPALARLATRFDAWLMSDDAHGLGVLGAGAGSAAAMGVIPDLQMGTLSKALGSYGGYLCANRPVIELMRTRARTLIYSTGLPPAQIAAAIAALDIIRKEPERVAAPLAKARLFTGALGLADAQSPIVPLVLGEEMAALRASSILEEMGFAVVAIRPPTVPAGTARLRIAFSALHADTDVARLAEIIRTRILNGVRPMTIADAARLSA
jgi:8-amino-7-oxononanoate synthase